MRGRITRRAALSQMGWACVWAQTSGAPGPQVAAADNDPLRQLRPAHPRLLLPDSELERIRAVARDNALARRIFGDLEKECDRLLSVPPVEYKLNGNRLQTQTRRALDRITTLALMYRLTNRDPWLRRAIMELNACAAFRDWNPTRFVDTAEMTHAFAIGYDWLYNSLSADERTWVRDALVAKGLDQALPIYQQKAWWTREHFNWNIVCNAAMTMGALAIGDSSDDALREKASEVMRGALESIPHGLGSYGADGGWPEGPEYGEYATRYACLFLASLDTALGNDYGLSGFHGLDKAGRFRVYSIGPGSRTTSFGDGSADAGLAPEMFWMARRFNSPVYGWSEQKQLERSAHPEAYDLAWFFRDAKPPQPPAWPLDAVFHGQSVATFRSSWEDPNALFLAVKGGDNKAPHAHLDLGSFVLDAGGVRWALDYEFAEATVPAAQRPATYAVRTESHNTMLVDGENQDPRAEARIVRQEFTADLSWVQIDLSKAYPRVKQWTRRIGIAQRQAVLIEDSLHGDQPVEPIWGMLTDAEISTNGGAATLKKNGWSLAVEIRTPRHAVFDVTPVKSPGNAKLQKLIVRVPEKVTDLDLNIALTPYRDGQPKAKITGQFPV
ncbi:MAG TPA: heparinase II/III family protein [Bryobacteraceae bacterium]|nr:heparinase II/III family protein [Bryobacteraceae bacterium]